MRGFLQFGPKFKKRWEFGCFGLGEYTIMIIIPKNEPESKEKQTVNMTVC